MSSLQAILEANTKQDLIRFLAQRQNLNRVNGCLLYTFHLVQSTGIFVSAYGTASDYPTLIWVGIGLNLMASLITAYEKQNTATSNKLLQDIRSIQDGSYTDESSLWSKPIDELSPKP